MAALGENLPNLKICVDNTDVNEDEEEHMEEDKDLEDGEIIDSGTEDVEFNVSLNPAAGFSLPLATKKYENPAGDFVTGLDLTSEEIRKKREERAKRFGLTSTVPTQCLDLTDLYESLGISASSIESGERGIRPEAIHLRGVEEMNTKDIFSYFKEYQPGTIEWIDDSSCNVVWLDPLSAARALIGLSNKVPQETDKLKSEKKTNAEERMDFTVHKNKESSPLKEEKAEKALEDEDTLNLMSSDEDEEENTRKEWKTESENKVQGKVIEKITTKDMQHENYEDNEKVNSKNSNVMANIPRDIVVDDIEMPPGKWRIGASHSRCKQLFLRYATKADKKQQGAERKSKFYQKYGNPNYNNMKGLITNSRKRNIRAAHSRKEIAEAREAVKSAPGLTTYEDLDMFGGTYVEPGDEPDVPMEDNRKISSNDLEYYQTYDRDCEEGGFGDEVKAFQGGDDPDQSDEDGLQYEKELEILLNPPPKKRTMRMYADDYEEEIEAKKQKIENIKQTMVKSVDARQKIQEKRKGTIHDRLGTNTGISRHDEEYRDLRTKLHKRDSPRGRLKDIPNIKIEVLQYEEDDDEEQEEEDLETFGI